MIDVCWLFTSMEIWSWFRST